MSETESLKLQIEEIDRRLHRVAKHRDIIENNPGLLNAWNLLHLLRDDLIAQLKSPAKT